MSKGELVGNQGYRQPGRRSGIALEINADPLCSGWGGAGVKLDILDQAYHVTELHSSRF